MASGWISKKYRKAIIERDNCTCQYCHTPVIAGANLLNGFTPSQVCTLDHITPRSEGGSHTAENLIVACMSCNSSRKALSLLDYVKDQSIADSIIAQTLLPVSYTPRAKKVA